MANLAHSAGSVKEEQLTNLLDPQALVLQQSVQVISAVTYSDSRCRSKEPKLKRLVLKLDSNENSLIIKYFFPNTLLRRYFYRHIKNDPLKNSFIVGNKLRSLTSIKSAEIYYLGQEKNFQFSFTVQEYLSKEIPISNYLRKLASSSADTAITKIDIIEWLATNFATIHNQSFYHGDIKPSHLFIRQDDLEKGQLGTFVWIDLDRASLDNGQLSTARRINNLYHALRYFVAPLGLQYAAHFFEHYLHHTLNWQIRPRELLERVFELYEKEIAKVMRNEPRGENGLLTKEDFTLV